MSIQVSFLRTTDTLLSGITSCRASVIFLIIFGYAVSQVTRSRTALPFGFERFPSPIAIPITYEIVLRFPAVGFVAVVKCRRWDSNPQALRRTILSRVRLPISSLRQCHYIIRSSAKINYCISLLPIRIFQVPHITLP